MAQYTNGKAWFENGSDIVRGMWAGVASGVTGAYVTDEDLACSPSGATIRLAGQPVGAAARFIRIASTPLDGDTVTGGAFSFSLGSPSLDLDWSTNVVPTAVGPLLTERQTNAWSPVISVLDLDRMQMAAAWPLATARDVDYLVHPDFTARHDLPLIGARDTQAAALMNRFCAAIDERLDAVRTVAKSAAYAIVRTDVGKAFLVDTTGAGVTLTLPLAAAVGAGFMFRVMRVAGSNAVTIARAGADTINGATSVTITTTFEFVPIFTNGTTWYRGV